MCSHEWDREANQYLKGAETSDKINSSDTYWESYEKLKPPMPPAHHILEFKIKGYVAEAVIPRFMDN
jgi:hypothetical protein